MAKVKGKNSDKNKVLIIIVKMAPCATYATRGRSLKNYTIHERET